MPTIIVQNNCAAYVVKVFATTLLTMVLLAARFRAYVDLESAETGELHPAHFIGAQ